MAERCIPLSDLKLSPITFNPDIYNRCGQLVIHLIDNQTKNEVGETYSKISQP